MSMHHANYTRDTEQQYRNKMLTTILPVKTGVQPNKIMGY